jgi:hypothetical protein
MGTLDFAFQLVPALFAETRSRHEHQFYSIAVFGQPDTPATGRQEAAA